MEDREDYDLHSVDNEEDSVWEAVQKGTSYSLEDLRKLVRVADNRFKYSIY
jgi:hypothetical protein